MFNTDNGDKKSNFQKNNLVNKRYKRVFFLKKGNILFKSNKKIQIKFLCHFKFRNHNEYTISTI